MCLCACKTVAFIQIKKKKKKKDREGVPLSNGTLIANIDPVSTQKIFLKEKNYLSLSFFVPISLRNRPRTQRLAKHFFIEGRVLNFKDISLEVNKKKEEKRILYQKKKGKLGDRK